MPTYVYECKTCEKVWELEQRITENAITECNCDRKQPVRRLIQPVGIAFKGQGFHINDYASSSAGTAETPSPSPAPAAPTETAATPAPAAPAAKPADS